MLTASGFRRLEVAQLSRIIKSICASPEKEYYKNLEEAKTIVLFGRRNDDCFNGALLEAITVSTYRD